MRNIKIITYSTLLECFEALHGESINLEEAKLNYWAGHDGSKPFRIRFDKWLKTTRKCWGWAEYTAKTIHIWIADDCSEEDIVVLLAHEIGHFQKPRYIIKADEEKKASMYEKVTKTAIEMTKTILVGYQPTRHLGQVRPPKGGTGETRGKQQ